MCLSNEEITEILKIQRRRFLARVRHNLSLKDGWGKPVTREMAEDWATNKYGQVSYQEFIKKGEYPFVGKGGFWRSSKHEIVRQRCPIPYMPDMPLTRCLTCNDPVRRILYGEKNARTS